MATAAASAQRTKFRRQDFCVTTDASLALTTPFRGTMTYPAPRTPFRSSTCCVEKKANLGRSSIQQEMAMGRAVEKRWPQTRRWAQRPMHASTMRLRSAPRPRCRSPCSSRPASLDCSMASATQRQDVSHSSDVPPSSMQERWQAARNAGRLSFGGAVGAMSPEAVTAQIMPIRIG